MQRDVYYVLLAALAQLLLVNHALPEELPCMDRLPELKRRTNVCDCREHCACTPACLCVGLHYNDAYRKACSEALPIVIYLNTEVHYVEGCVVCHVDKWEGVDFKVGVIIGAPSCWAMGHKVKVEQMVVAECYGPRSPENIKAILNDYKAKIDAKWHARDMKIYTSQTSLDCGC